MGGLAVGMLNGFTLPKFWKFQGYRLKPLMTKYTIPPLMGMIIMGCVARNYIGGQTLTAFPGYWSQWIINCVVALHLTRGGLQVTFRFKQLLMMGIMILPQLCEVAMIALITYGFFRMPVEICFCMGYAVGTVANSIVVPGAQAFIKGKLNAKSKDMEETMKSGSAIDNLFAIIGFGICRAITFNYASDEVTGESESMGYSVGMVFV